MQPQYDRITFNAYGEGSRNPLITGFIPLLAGTHTENEGNVLMYPLPTRPTVVTMNGNLLEIGRTPNRSEPNGGYYTYYTPGTDGTGNYIVKHNTNTYVEDAKKVVIRTNPFSIETKAIKQFDDVTSRIYYHPTTGFNGANYSFSPTDKFGYYFQDGLSTLDMNGEWYYDERDPNDDNDNMLCVYFNDEPVNLKVATLDILCNLGQHNNIKIQNIDFDGANRMGVDMGDNSDIVENKNIYIQNCNFTNMGIRAIHARHTLELYVAECSFSNCLSGGVQFYTFYYSGWRPVNKIKFNSFNNIAPYPGMAYNTDAGDNNAIHMFTSSTSDISGNSFNNIGKAAIYWQGNDIEIAGNKISNAMKYFCDYGAIYTYDDGSYGQYQNRIIQNNLVHDCPGDINGTNLSASIANGIYLDGITSNVVVKKNTVFDMGSSGIMSNNPRNITLEENILYNNVNGIRYSHLLDYLPNDDIDITITDNRIYSERGQVNGSLLNSGNTFAAAISFVSTMSSLTTDLQNTHL